MPIKRKKKYKNHEEYLKYKEEKRKQEESMNDSDKELLKSFRETSNMNRGYYNNNNKKYNNYKNNNQDNSRRVYNNSSNTEENKPKVEYDSRKAAYHEKSHCYDLNAYATLVASGIKPEEAKKILIYFYTDIIDELHKNEPQFKKSNNMNNNKSRINFSNKPYVKKY